MFLPVVASNPFAQEVIDSFYQTGYLMQLVGFFQITSGLMLILNQFTNLGILIALPVSINIAAYTIFTSNFGAQSVIAAALVVGANFWLLFRRRKNYFFIFNKI